MGYTLRSNMKADIFLLVSIDRCQCATPTPNPKDRVDSKFLFLVSRNVVRTPVVDRTDTQMPCPVLHIQPQVPSKRAHLLIQASWRVRQQAAETIACLAQLAKVGEKRLSTMTQMHSLAPKHE